MTFTINENPVPKKNSMQIVKIGSVTKVIPSQKYRDYERKALLELKAQGVLETINYPVNIKYLFYRDSKRRVDLSNLIEGADDILVKAGIILDDNRNIVASHDGSRVYCDKVKPRTVILIEKADEDYEGWN